ncbi:(2Fe-2S)-binding protein [Streptomyces marincola]|uniref:(2Fe-2S)-binding protein n=1 Tax=Streptomyces marincola TaxID=2878388 RepID=UPI001CF0F67A|nr:(2Fe-2S)-binding protein [Streptomyces marincola]UCM87904.1 (2Fe-2S)-binding protein [Streptomyces marincola]
MSSDPAQDAAPFAQAPSAEVPSAEVSFARAPFTEALNALGPFFSVRQHAAGAAPRPPWQPMSRLAPGSDALLEHVAAVRAGLARTHGVPPERVESRVAASVAHLGLAARLLSPALALAVLRRRALAGSLDALWWQPVLGRPVPLSVAAEDTGAGAEGTGGGGPGTAHADASPAAFLGTYLADGPVAGLDAAFASLSVPPAVLRGNVASALHGATAAFAAGAGPGPAATARAALTRLLTGPALRGAVGTAPNGAFRRRSCCLIYRAAPDRAGPVCGDCVLLDRRRGRG